MPRPPSVLPYRAALLTGQYPARTGIVDYLRPDSAAPLTTDHVTIAELLKQAGYATGMTGKWHLTGYRHHGAALEVRPTDHGFDEELVTEIKSVGNGANYFPYVFRTRCGRLKKTLTLCHRALYGREPKC